MTRPPDFRELVGDDLPAEEQERLRNVHDLLVAAGPPPELPERLAEPPRPAARIAFIPRRRLRTALVLAAGLAVALFAAGYFVGERGDAPRPTAFAAAKTVLLGKGRPVAVVRIGARDGNGNRPMLVTVEGLRSQPAGSYYTLYMTKNRKPIAPCGSFNVRDGDETTVRFLVGYDLEQYDGLLLAVYRHGEHKQYPLLRAPL